MRKRISMKQLKVQHLILIRQVHLLTSQVHTNCEITADVKGSVKDFLPDATDAQVEAYSKLVKSTNKVTVEATKITVDTTLQV